MDYQKICPTCRTSFPSTTTFCPQDGTPVEPDLNSLIGQVLDDRYHLENILGIGGMGAVFRARDRILGPVAIKVLSPKLSHNPDYVKRFLYEGQAARHINHPNVVTIYDLRQTPDGMPYLVMECLEGKPLDRTLSEQKRFAPAQALDILEPIFHVLALAHRRGVIHRDLKPSNIFICDMVGINGKPIVKLLDLGIAKLLDKESLTLTGMVQGTPHYMSPEQWGLLSRDRNPAIDGRADLYSLGVVVFELVAGRKPFTGSSVESLSYQHGYEIPPELSQIVHGIPQAFSQAVARSLAKDRCDRQENCEEFLNELKVAVQFASRDGLGESGSQTSPEIQVGTRSSVDPSAQTVGHTRGPVKTQSPVKSVTNPGSPKPPDTLPAPPPKIPIPPEMPPDLLVPTGKARSKSAGLWTGGVILALVMGMGGWFIWKQTHPAVTEPPPKPPIETSVEVMRYWLEVTPNPDKPTERKAGEVVVPFGQFFKFFFRSKHDGYIYVIGPGKKNAPTAFLTVIPTRDSGLKTNALKANQDQSYPKEGADYFLRVNSEKEPDTYTVVFSQTAIENPEFFKKAAGHELTVEELKEWDVFRHKYPSASTSPTNEKEPSIAISQPKNQENTTPVVFEIIIKHQ